MIFAQGDFTSLIFSHNNNELTELTNERINIRRKVEIRKFVNSSYSLLQEANVWN